MSDAALSCISSLLSRGRPRLAHALLGFLRGHGLQDVFLQQLLEHLAVEERSERWAEEVCAILALLPHGPDSSRARLEPLWERLQGACDGPLTEERVLGCLLRPHDQTLLTLYCSTALRLLRERLLREAPHTRGEIHRKNDYIHLQTKSETNLCFFKGELLHKFIKIICAIQTYMHLLCVDSG